MPTRREFLSLALKLLTGAGGDVRAGPLTVTISCGGVGVSYSATAAEIALLLASAGLPEMQVNIIQALAELGDGDWTVPRIARQAGYKVSSRFYTEFRRLQVVGLVLPTPDGYRLDVLREKTSPGGT